MFARKNRYWRSACGLMLLVALAVHQTPPVVALDSEQDSIAILLERAKAALEFGEGEKNAGEAWYWLKRAQQKGADISTVTQLPLQEMLKRMNAQERRYLAYLADYHDDLDLSGVLIPPSFAPLSREVPKPLTDKEIRSFQSKFEGLNRKEDREQYNAVERELVARTVGIRNIGNVSIEGQVRPFGMSKREFVRRKCNYWKATARIFQDDGDEIARQLRARTEALSSYFRDESARYVRKVMQTGKVCPNKESRAMAAGLEWARRLKRSSPSMLRELAAKHIEMSGSISTTKFDPGQDGWDRPDVHVGLYHFMLGRALQNFAARQGG